ncbi:MAG: O-antigen ligase domain-containing protein [Acidobacteria bacterium]|nr:MAG: O-antigen ligase domain-containing protein [Acidobacteriota bacterium]REK10157.1 MAG: O-antigen ligase domain-containing protein [Acidobacteriota bacterium]
MSTPALAVSRPWDRAHPAASLEQSTGPARWSYAASPGTFLLLAALHAGLAILFRAQPVLGVPHALATFGYGVLVAIRRPQAVLPVVAYLAGAELLWRMNQVPVSYESGKLFCIAILAVALVRGGRARTQSAVLLFGGALFLPAITATVANFGWTELARSSVSFHLTGPVLLAVGAAALASLPPVVDLNRVLAAFSIPVLGLGAFVLYSTATATEIRYTTESNFATSGGFGPNQVSLTLAFGAVALAILAVASARQVVRWLLILAALFLLSLSVFTFSRTGLYCAVAGFVVLALHLIVGRYRGLRLIGALALMTLLGTLLVFPQLDRTSGGNLSQRFAEANPASRIDLMRTDWHTFLANPLLGVGVGVSPLHRDDPNLVGVTAHTEYSRALAEHGLLGLLAMTLLFGSWVQRQLTARSLWQRAVTGALGGAAFVALAASAVRLAIIPFFLILAFSTASRTTEPGA